MQEVFDRDMDVNINNAQWKKMSQNIFLTYNLIILTPQQISHSYVVVIIWYGQDIQYRWINGIIELLQIKQFFTETGFRF